MTELDSVFGPEKFIVDIVPRPKLIGPIIGWTIDLSCSLEVLLTAIIASSFGVRALNARRFVVSKAAGIRYAIWSTAVLSILMMNFACAHSGTASRDAGEACLQREIRRLASLPEKEVITTLDGQLINLNHFLYASSINQPGCSLPYKFYHWPSEIKEADSKGSLRIIRHRIRAYYNMTSTCYPEKRETGQVYGDVAEFYDEDLVFMGFAIYVGNGLYCPLPHAGYTGPASLEAAKYD